jgi:hypothetical protein
MAATRASVLSWIEGFEAASEADRAAARTGDPAPDIAISLQLSEAALAARAHQMKARREAEDARARGIWCRLKPRRRR